MIDSTPAPRAAEAGDDLVFVLAPPHSGARPLLDALAEVPGLCTLAGTAVLGHGIARLFRHYKPPTGVGLVRLVDEQQLVDGARKLADAVFETYRARQGCTRLVEYSASNILFAHQVRALYPRSQLIHLVRDARTAVRAAAAARTSLGPVGRDARTWARAHRSLLYGPPLAGLLRLRFEAMADRPEEALRTVLGHIGTTADAARFQAALGALRRGIEASARAGGGRPWWADPLVRCEVEAELALLGYVRSLGRPGKVRRTALRVVDETCSRLGGLPRFAHR